MYLIFDTETTGLPKDWRAPIEDVDNWPRVIQIAWILFDDKRKPVSKNYSLIKPEGWEVPVGEFWQKNGFSQAYNARFGVPFYRVLAAFFSTIKVSEYLIAHNMSFDWPVLCAETYRLKVMPPVSPVRICTKEAATEFCKIPGLNGGYKWPSLSELHKTLFNRDFEGAHDALSDVEALAKCFFGLQDAGVIKINQPL